MYYDETPKNCPPTMITQCQQWGFQRLVPCFDDMTAKCTYKTTITADSRYTNIITNGDVIEPRRNIGNGRDRVAYQNNIPMPPYLFFLGVGTYKTFKRKFEYPNGDKFDIELLALVDSKEEPAQKAIDILYDSIMWVYLFCGPDRYKNEKTSKEMWQLIKERDILLKEGKDASAVRKKLFQLNEGRTFGFKYSFRVYREIAMQNSDFGGMENLGNTTITANRIMPYKEMPDGGFEYMIAVKVHEFYHNLNGSQVTGWSPFELWLNEAVTVHIERQFEAFVLGKNYQRLKEVLGLLSPDRGTFQLDEGAMSMPILPDGLATRN
jgi:aminopeptidase N